ncbi:MAG: fimbrillin family protein [Rikenellaceae bacterium]
MKKYIVYLILSALIFAGCQEDLEFEAIVVPEALLLVSLPGGDNSSRVSFADSNGEISLTWKGGDTFGVYDSAGERVSDYKYTANSSGGAALFEASDNTNLLVNGSSYTAVYPAVDNATNLDEHREILVGRVLEQTQGAIILWTI